MLLGEEIIRMCLESFGNFIVNEKDDYIIYVNNEISQFLPLQSTHLKIK